MGSLLVEQLAWQLGETAVAKQPPDHDRRPSHRPHLGYSSHPQMCSAAQLVPALAVQQQWVVQSRQTRCSLHNYRCNVS